MHSVNSFCISFFFFLLSYFILSVQLNDGDEHSAGSKVRAAKSNPVRKAGSAERGSCLGTNRQHPGRGKQSNWLWAASVICTVRYVSRVFPFSLTFLLTCCLFLFSFKTILSKEGDKTLRKQSRGKKGFRKKQLWNGNLQWTFPSLLKNSSMSFLDYVMHESPVTCQGQLSV